MRTIIAFHGRKEMGKSTAATLLVHEYGARPLSFAEPLYRTVSRAFDIPIAVMHDRATKEAIDPRYGVSPRWLLQHVGDGVRAGLGADILIRALVDTVTREDWPLYVVDDCRYLEEVQALRRLEDKHPMAVAGYVIHLERLDAPPGTDDHQSEIEAQWETDMDGWIEWSSDKPLDSQVEAEMRRLCGRFVPVRRALNLAAMRGGWPSAR